MIHRAPVALFLFAAAGAAGWWSHVPAPLLFVALAMLPGLAALAGFRGAAAAVRGPGTPSDTDGASAVVAGPGRAELHLYGPGSLALAAALSLALFTTGVLPLFLSGASLSAATVSLPLVFVLVALASSIASWAASTAGATTAPPAELRLLRREWAVFVAATACLLPVVMHYAGGTVDDWWDMSFVRAYADATSLKFSEPVLGTGLVHPRFLWTAWLSLQAFVVACTGADPAWLQIEAVAPLVCVLVVSAVSLFARVVFPNRPVERVLTTALTVPWLYGTEALPFFLRLHQDKFVAGLVFLPALLTAVRAALQATDSRTGESAACRTAGGNASAWPLVLLAGAVVALVGTHGLVYCVGFLGAGLVLAAHLRPVDGGLASGLAFGLAFGRTSARSWQASGALLLSALLGRWKAVGGGRLAWVVALLVTGAALPLAQGLWLGPRFAAQGIDLSVPDNPVVRAHLWLDRLLLPETLACVVHPGAVFGWLALAGVVGLMVCARRRDTGSRILGSLAAVPVILIFTPGLVAVVGEVFVPWMIYRIGWLVPVPALLAAACGAAIELRGLLRLAAVSALGLLIVVPAVLAGLDQHAREFSNHAEARQRVPRGDFLEVMRFLRSAEGEGAVIARRGVATLTPPLAGRPVVATSERGTLVFSPDERGAYERLRDRSQFFSPTAGTAERRAIVARYGVDYAVFRRRTVERGEERRWVTRFGRYPQPAILDGSGLPTATATRAELALGLPADWTVEFANPSFFVVRTGVGLADSRLADSGGPDLAGTLSAGSPVGARADDPANPGDALPAWLRVFAPTDGESVRFESVADVIGEDGFPRVLPAPAGRDVIASTRGYPGSRVVADPPPAAGGGWDRAQWASPGNFWDDAPSYAVLQMDWGADCPVTGLRVVPFLRRGRREVLEVDVDGRTVRFEAEDGRPAVIRLDRRVRSGVAFSIRSMLGAPLGFGRVEVLGLPADCSAGWPRYRQANFSLQDSMLHGLFDVAHRYQSSARTLAALALAAAPKEPSPDGEALLRQLLFRDVWPPSAEAPAAVELGLLLERRKQSAEASRWFERAARADSRNAWARGVLAWSEERRGRRFRALFHGIRAFRLDPRYADAHTVAALAFGRLGARAAAREQLLEAIRLDPARSWPYLVLSGQAVRAGDVALSRRMLLAYLRRNPADAGVAGRLRRHLEASVRAGAKARHGSAPAATTRDAPRNSVEPAAEDSSEAEH